MKKIIIYFFIIIGICFIIPIFFTTRFKIKEVSSEEKETELLEIEKYSYTDFSTIKLLHKDDGSVQEVGLDDYIAEVVSAEIPVDYEIEAIKAQSIAARSYTIYKIIHGSKHENADICDDYACCQAWISKEDRIGKWGDGGIEKWNKIVEAVNSTAGEVATYDGQVINAFFHSNSGGTTETALNVWGGGNYPYLQSVETSGEDAYAQYKSEVILTEEELINKLKEKYSDIQINFSNDDDIKIIAYTESGRVKTARFGNREIARSRDKDYFGTEINKFSDNKRKWKNNF